MLSSLPDAPVLRQNDLPQQANFYPSTRFMGSKRKILPYIADVMGQLECETALDLFSGSGIVSYLLKAMGKSVVSNDYMAMSVAFAKSMVQNDHVTLSEKEVNFLVQPSKNSDHFVERTFAGLYFDDEENSFIDTVRSNIPRLENEYARSIATAALVRACMKKRPRGIFTYTGNRYDDGRRDLRLPLEDQFFGAVRSINSAVFEGSGECLALQGDAMRDLCREFDVVYLDPPYYSPLSDNEYVRRYHFVEGLARNWDGVEIQQNTKTKKFKSYPTPFATLKGSERAFEELFDRYRRSAIVVSYSSNSLPSKEDLAAMLENAGKRVEILPVSHTYSFGNQRATKAGSNRNKVREYLFVAC